jgi:hypothetical protein
MDLFDKSEKPGKRAQALSKPLQRGNEIISEWLESCTRGKKISRNTVAVGTVILDHLRRRFPTNKDEVISEGGEIRGSRGAKLGRTLEQYGISKNYLKEVTTRQSHQDAQRLLNAFESEELFARLTPEQRDAVLLSLIEDRFVSLANEWLNRPSLELDVERRLAPGAWIRTILERVKGKSGGVVEQHLVGAKLERRYGDEGIDVPNHPAHAADVQTERKGDFVLGNTVYHVTATPSVGVIQKCERNVIRGEHPILLVPEERKAAAIALAELQNVQDQISIISIEEFVALNIIELATGHQTNFFNVLEQIITIYNRRLEEVETDLSLKINVR